MARAVSKDLLLRVVRGIVAGKSRSRVAAQFGGSGSTVVRVQARFEATGSFEPAKQGRLKGSGNLGPYRAGLIEKVETVADITMLAPAAWLESEHGVMADPSILSRLLRRAGYSFKNGRCWPPKKNTLMSRQHVGPGSNAVSPSCTASRRGSSSSMKPA